jgi:3-hydroxymyristoyl/3-hydroxydecanoyl-(acyl carrier protein) dehydratase
VSAVIAVPSGDPLFEGHFPGRPILPGISQLVLIARALAPEAGTHSVSALPFVRFRGLVGPDERLDLSRAPREAGGLRFETKRDGAPVANGAMVFGPPVASEPRAIAVAARPPRGVPPIETLIPHRAPMLFVEQLLGEAEDGATCVGRIPAGSALVTDGVTPAFVALELAAQTAAVWEAHHRAGGEGAATPVAGYLVSIKDAVLHRSAIPADADLFASVRLTAMVPPLTTYAVEVVVEGGLALTATIGTFLSATAP